MLPLETIAVIMAGGPLCAGVATALVGTSFMPHCAHLAGTEPGQLRMHRADQIGADLPKPCRGGFVVAALGGFLRFGDDRPRLRPARAAGVVEAVPGHILQPGYDFGNEFEFGLNVILDALTRSVPNKDGDSPADDHGFGESTSRELPNAHRPSRPLQ
jgi:hypothetical protein